ncbi:MAG TPA: helix-turn-helix transcriptional regulator [Candidatus Limadaptatus stercorigallinarum]|uniref:Helix-turn-helix transcriptional regulator n=1 Tax=Candidatus Limadaptatus stercorigallinarum TaxID=2840845 RepID=A0A9D1L3C8_9FIRM|nr:helix-turn-helix transcriptional regulator [Christensenellales bacterium]HIU21788.1 helix-turn-helix transcriptional regulator [Candidatus Limadaptatus stercorigallinarum]
MNNKFAERLSEFLREEKISQRQFAASIGVTAACVSYWRSGKKQPTAENLYLIAKAYNLSIDFLLGVRDY